MAQTRRRDRQLMRYRIALSTSSQTAIGLVNDRQRCRSARAPKTRHLSAAKMLDLDLISLRCQQDHELAVANPILQASEQAAPRPRGITNPHSARCTA